MKIRAQTRLRCPADQAWAAMQTVALFEHVAAPVLRFAPLPGCALPARWQEGETVRGRMFLFGWLPLGGHAVTVVRIDPHGRTIVTREQGGLLRRWEHTLQVRPAGRGEAVYGDAVDFDAGLLGGAVKVFAELFFRHRQRRWRQLARGWRGAAPA
jgi:hypothetical protein